MVKEKDGLWNLGLQCSGLGNIQEVLGTQETFSVVSCFCLCSHSWRTVSLLPDQWRVAAKALTLMKLRHTEELTFFLAPNSKFRRGFPYHKSFLPH